MTSLTFAEATPVWSELTNKLKDLKPTPLFFYPYLKHVLETRFEQENPQYPMTVKIAAENKCLLKGELDPVQEIVIPKPILTEEGSPMWFASSARDIKLRFGYDNCDARFISSQKLDMEYIHAFLGGSSGHGKSVTMNSTLGSLFYEYAPWELEVHMSDAKIIEFKKYGVGHRIPHISTIAATEDPDYVISVLEKAKDEMNQRAKIFGNLGVSNLKNFREKTGLAYPRVLIVMDEVESTFKLAGKKAQKIADLIDAFARLGRAAGYHLFMATQNMSSDIPKSATGQIRVRMCLGANQTTSDSVLGNGGACENFGRIGMLIVNTEVLNGGNTYPHNVKYKTPFLTDDNFEREMKELEQTGRDLNYTKTLAFYDEEDMKTLASYDSIMSKVLARMSKTKEISSQNSSVLLGYPAFVSDDTDGLLKLNFNHQDVENVVICSAQTDRVAAHLHNFAFCMKDHWSILHYSSDVSMFAQTPSAISCEEVRDATQSPLLGLDGLIRKRLFLAYFDNLVKNEGSRQYKLSDIENLFAEEKIPKEHWGVGLMQRRAAAFYDIQKDPTHASMWNPVACAIKSFKDYYEECVRYNAIIDPMTVANFGNVAYFLGDLSKIVGYGRDPASKILVNLKKAMQDCNRAGIVFILYTRSMEGMNDLLSGLRYAIFDAPDSKDWGRLRAEAPPSLSNNLAVLYDTLDSQNPQRKFKRTLLREEL